MKNLHLVAHTHWDREWYKPFQVFRVKLVYMIDRLIDELEADEGFTSFMLDGQTIVLEDYLRIRPEKGGRLKKLTEAGRIITGPWYIQPDEFAPDAESLVRNLQIGIRTSAAFGRPMFVGYLPDSFGHSAQMPQILRGFGIDSAVVMRGVDFDRINATEFNWKGLNGDEVLGIYLYKGYMNAMFLSASNTFNAARLKKLESELGSLTQSDSVLVMNGVDHAFSQPYAGLFCSRHDDRKLDSLEAYIRELQQKNPVLDSLEGELITPRHHRVHTSIASSRIYQKLENRRLSILFERVLEPLCLITHLYGAEYPGGLIEQAWKILLSNQTHDGICGCCTDEVHREMDQRFAEAGQIAETLIKNQSRALSYSIRPEGFGFTVINTALASGPRYINAEIFVDSDFIIEDEAGRKVEVQLTSVEDVDVSKNSIWTLYLGTSQPAKKVGFVFVCNFDSVLGYKSYCIRETVAGEIKNTPSSVSGNESNCSFENAFYRLNIQQNGSLSVYSKETKQFYEGLNVFEDTGEGGDSYNHSPIENDTPVFSRYGDAQINLTESGKHRTSFCIVQKMTVPESLADDDRSRSRKTVEMKIITNISVYADSRRIDFAVDINNQALSHRIRALFPFGASAGKSFAETQFGVIERNTETPSGGDGWPETPLPVYSMQRFAGLKNESGVLVVLNRGLSEYEIYNPDDAVLAVTLHRGVSMMGKAELVIRPGRPSGVELPVPDAESIGMLHREYSLLIGPELDASELVWEADFYVNPGLAVQNKLKIDKIQNENKDFFEYLEIENLTSVISDSMHREVPVCTDLVSLESLRLSVSAVNKAFDDDSVIIRLFNPGSEPVEGERLYLGFPHSRVFLVNLFEQEIEVLIKDGGWILPTVGPCSQITVKVAREE